jgi:sigma-B regulation protein RsbU (phosphoserine phosphatase)
MFPNVKYEEFTLSTQPGDSLIFFSDGLADAENSAGDMFGDDRLKAVVKKCHGKPASKIADSILSEVSKFQGGRERFDDETVVVLKVL